MRRHLKVSKVQKNKGREALLGLLLASLFGAFDCAHATEVDTGNPDVVISWNNTIRYNWARRMESRDPHVVSASGGAYDQGDMIFDKGDTITNRLDLLSELNFAYMGLYGARLSAAAWYDAAYGSKGKSAPGFAPSVANNDFNDYTKRYFHGPSAEFVDAYVFGNFALGEDATANVRFGRHAVVWGEGLFGSTHSIAFSQAPSDAGKAVASPGASAKETALPVHQVSTTIVVNPQVTVLAHYQFEWRPSRYPEAGTYFSPGDAILKGSNVLRVDPQNGSSGSYGLGLKYSPEWLDGTLGLYYRKFDENVGGWATQPIVNGGTTTTTVYAKNIELWGLTLSKSIAGMSVGAELSHRKNSNLTSSSTATAGAANRYEGAIGDTWHGVLNGIALFSNSNTFGWDNSSLSAEVAWSKLDKLTKNQTLYRSQGYFASCASNSATAKIRGCVDGDFYSLGVQFNPTYQQVYPGVDLSVPLFFSKNFGNAPTAGGGSDGFTTYKVGLSALAWQKHQFDLSYTWWDQHIDRTIPTGRLLGSPYLDKGFLGLTYQTTF